MKVLRVLIVDDHPQFQNDFVELLKKNEMVEIVGVATNGLEAISKVKLLQPDIVFMDISMPMMNGIEASLIIKVESPRTKIVFVTIHEDQTYQALAEVIHADGFVCKSTLKNDLPNVLKKFTNNGQE